MSESPNPALSVRAVPPHRERWDKIGRLYRKPDFILPDDYQSLPVLKELIRNGDLMPSITNVIDVKNSPYLVDWAAKLVAKEAVKIAVKHINQILEREEAAFKYLKNLPHTEKTFWGTQGTNVHYACELLFLGQDISHLTFTAYEKACIEHFKRWLDIFQPQVNYTELTGFGTTKNNLNYAGTADFNITVDGVNILGDIKCTTDDTLVLMKDGSQKQAKDIRVGDEVVSWSEQEGLRVDRIVHAGSNGKKQTYTVVTALGQNITVTGNHKFLKRSEEGMVWVESEKLTTEDRVYVVSGWAHSPNRTETEYPYNKHLSPYLLGMLWSLAQFNEEPWADSGKVAFPVTARAELFDELASFGFTQSADGRVLIKTGLRRVANKAKIEIDDLLSLLNSPTIPDYVFSAPLIFQTAFISGVQEVFANKSINADFFFVQHRSTTSLLSLQQLYINNGQLPELGRNTRNQLPVLRLPLQSGEQVHIYGLEEVRIVRIEENLKPVHTIALEVENTHNHVTGGILTHNTNRSGLHASVALQLAANRNVDSVSPTGTTLIDPPQVDMTAGLHLSPEGFEFRQVDSGDEVYEIFESLRTVWNFHAFEGALEIPSGVFGKNMKTPADI